MSRSALSRIVASTATGVLLVIIGAELYIATTNPLGAFRSWGGDYGLYTEAAQR